MAEAAVNDVHTDVRTLWLRHIGALSLVLAVLAWFFWPNIQAALTVYWVSPTYSHCYLIVPISAWLVWNKRDELRTVRPQLFLPALVLLIPLAAGWYFGHLVAINEAQQFALMAMAQVIMLALFGWPVYRVLMFPALFLFFLVPTGEYLVPPLQRFTTHFITTFLSLMRIPYYAEGTIIELANGRYQVEEACAGLRFLIATIALGALYAHLTYRKWSKIALFMLACFVVPVIGNGFRALGIVLLAHYSDNRIAVGFDHLVYGWGFSVAIMLLLFFVGARWRDEFPAPKTPAQAGSSASVASLALAAILSALAVAAAPSYASWRESRPLNIDRSAFSQPSYAGWQIGKATDAWQPSFAGEDFKYAFSMDRSDMLAPPVDVFVYYYGRARNGHTLIESTNKMWSENTWNAASSGKVTARVGVVDAPFGELQLASSMQRRLVWWTYWARGTFTTSGLKVKIERLKGSFAGKDGSALVAVSVPVEEGTEDQARQVLADALAAMTDLPGRLDRAQAH
ncbi:MAG TPA: exosortase A [Rhizomicrobium sp.]|nr:exosortase A [Rhizomicrobium sp.]